MIDSLCPARLAPTRSRRWARRVQRRAAWRRLPVHLALQRALARLQQTLALLEAELSAGPLAGE